MANTDQSPPETKTLTAQCYCKAIHYTLEVPVSKLPLRVHMCHCSICRQTHGTLCIFHTMLPAGIEPRFVAPSSLANATGYTHAKAKSERFFCSTCGCHLGDRSLDAKGDVARDADGWPEWIMSSSLFSHDQASFRLGTHALTDCATGPGKDAFHTWLPRVGGDRELAVWNPHDHPEEWDMTLHRAEREVDPDSGRERLRAQCHCGGVSFTVPRPGDVPGLADDPVLRQWVSPEDPRGKWMACLDACDDCRLVSGAHVVAWTFVPRAVIEPAMPRDLAGYGTMKSYASSPGVLRGFCGVCGATAIYWCAEREPTAAQAVVDVAVGLLRAPEGVLAEEWLTWRTGRVGWHASGERFDREFVEALAKGMREWGVARDGKAHEWDIGPAQVDS